MSIKTYSELSLLPTFIERFRYLQQRSTVGDDTFGFARYLNQGFYQSRLWRSIRNEVILRDNGMDLGVDGRDIFDRIIIHHLNPITEFDLEEQTDFLVNPEFLICVSHNTHNAIHYGDETILFEELTDRFKSDTKLW